VPVTGFKNAFDNASICRRLREGGWDEAGMNRRACEEGSKAGEEILSARAIFHALVSSTLRRHQDLGHKRVEMHTPLMALHYTYFTTAKSFTQTPRMTSAMAADVSTYVWSVEIIVARLGPAREPAHAG
jgi:hypothetical protein